VLEAGADDALASESHVLAERDRRPPAAACLGHGNDERLDVGRLFVEVLERVEQVADEELRVETGEGLRPREVVETEAAAGREYGAGLPRLQWER
jgi:hypothetical protein